MPLTALIAAIIAPLIAILIMYLISALASPPPRKSSERDAPYACGEDFPPERPVITINLFWYITLFLVFDVIDFTLALAFAVNPLIPLTYLAIIIASLLVALGWK